MKCNVHFNEACFRAMRKKSQAGLDVVVANNSSTPTVSIQTTIRNSGSVASGGDSPLLRCNPPTQLFMLWDIEILLDS